MNLHEPLYNYKYAFELPNGDHKIDRILAHTEWHAMEKAYAKHCSEQPDRTKYAVTSQALGLNKRVGCN